ncbi:ABC transporter ATP-binding protein [Natronosalvus caseinilyticus]|uniref:ABC transporter ATP-binding protein n=1 Tax=Natronosalvus caseinilyticus TaxID=2953747 RepID=UPI0028B1D0E8|nr:ABC transporter ATP-binding protein [Natronosalvus caseinilyticus]
MAQTTHSRSETERNTHVEIDDLLKIYQDDDDPVTAVENLSLEIKEEEFLVLVGPSGCGKTTTLRCVAGLETTTEGKIVIDGEDVTGLDPRQRDVAMVFQNYALYPHKTVRENLAFPLQIRNVANDEVEERVAETAEILSITELLDRKPKDLSGGQQQRVALGRAIIRNASVFLFDEPLSNLDAKLRAQMRTELNKLHKKIGKTTIYVTHDQAEAMMLGDRIAVLNLGELQQVGTPEEIYDEPANRFVAGFIGEPAMNFLPIDVRKAGDRWVVDSDLFELDVPESFANRYPLSEWAELDLTLGVRPESFHDAALATGEHTESDTFTTYVKVIEPVGADKYVTFTDVDRESDAEFTARIDSESEATEERSLEIVADLEDMHVFNDRTGKNLTR